MIIPVLNNAKEIILGWKTGEEIEKKIGTEGFGETFDQGQIPNLIQRILEIKKDCQDKIEFDRRCAKLLYQSLKLSPAAAAERRFWQWFSVVHAREIVQWRWAKSGKLDNLISEDRWLGHWKDTFRRLWLRSHLVEDLAAKDPTWLMGVGDEDYWVSIIERDLAACRLLVLELTRRFFANNGIGISRKKMSHWRLAIKRIRQIRPSRACEVMSCDEIKNLVNDALIATKIKADNTDNKVTDGKKKKPKRTKPKVKRR